MCTDNLKKWKKSTKTVYDQIMEVKRVKASVVFDSRYAIFSKKRVIDDVKQAFVNKNTELMKKIDYEFKRFRKTIK